MWPLFSYRERQDVVGYHTAHKRVTKKKGRADSHDCVDCDDPAKQWSYDHTDADELVYQDGEYSYPYSLDEDHYQPRCLSCHRQFDLGRE